LTPRSALLPLVLMVAAGIIYLRSFTLGGNDLALIVILAIAGIVLGTVSGFAELRRDDAGRLIARAGALSVAAWALGIGSRFVFVYYAYHSGGPSVACFSASRHITGAQI
jgi:hypothetical protein